MACKCRRVEVPGTGRGKPIKGIIYCDECVQSLGRSNQPFKMLLLETLRTELNEIKELSESTDLRFSFDGTNVN